MMCEAEGIGEENKVENVGHRECINPYRTRR
jgi:hypothetical protein